MVLGIWQVSILRQCYRDDLPVSVAVECVSDLILLSIVSYPIFCCLGCATLPRATSLDTR